MSTLALDLGGTNLRAALWDGAQLRSLRKGPAPKDLAEFEALLHHLIATERPAQLGLAIPGLAESNRCRWVPNLPWLDGFSIAQFGLPCALGNDAQLALLAEAERGAAKGAQSAMLLAIGTGIGSAVLAQGHILQGTACSFGWASADMSDEGHPNSGWLERHASGRALDAIAHNLGLKNGAALIESARQGAHLDALLPATRALGTALSSAVSLLGLERVIVSGGVSRALDVLAPQILQSLRKHLPRHLQSVRIEAGIFGEDASLLGAALAGNSPLWKATS